MKTVNDLIKGKELYTHEELVGMIWTRVKIHGSLVACAKSYGVSPGYLHDVMNGNRKIGPKLMSCLAVKRITIFVSE